MKKLIAFPIFLIFMGFTPSAHADRIEIPGYATVNFPTTVKLQKTGCQEIPFSYETDENLARENTVFIVAIAPQNSKKAYGYAPWFSTQTYMGDKALPAMARIGVLQVKICRKPFLYSSKATVKTPGISPGTYRIIFDAGNTDPATGAVVGERIELFRTIKLL